MKLIDEEALLNDVKSLMDYSPEDDYDEGWNDALEMCTEAIKQACREANEEAAKTPVSMDGIRLGYLTPSEMSLKAPKSGFIVNSNDNTIKALKAAREAIEDTYDTEAAVAFIDGMLTALEI